MLRRVDKKLTYNYKSMLTCAVPAPLPNAEETEVQLTPAFTSQMAAHDATKGAQTQWRSQIFCDDDYIRIFSRTLLPCTGPRIQVPSRCRQFGTGRTQTPRSSLQQDLQYSNPLLQDLFLDFWKKEEGVWRRVKGRRP